MKTQPTPPPWTYKFVEMGGYDCMFDSIDILDGNQIVAKLDLSHYDQDACEHDNPEPRKKAEARATLIVRAVNNHASLLTACKNAAELLARVPAFGDTIGTEISKAQCGIALRELAEVIARIEKP